MSEIVDTPDCPSFDDISAYIDGEGEAKHREHIESCDVCRRVADSLRALDAAVGSACRAPEGLAGRVIAACREDEAAPPVATPFWSGGLLRYAAALVLTIGLALAVRTAVDHSGERRVAVTDDASSMQETGAETVPIVGGGTVGRPAQLNRDMLPVTANTKIGRPSPVPVTGRRLLPGRVDHLWTVPNVAAVEPWLEAKLPEGTWRVTERRRDSVSVRLRAVDSELQELVQGMYDKGWHLLSDDLPQPDRLARVRFDGRPVLYGAEFVNGSVSE